MKVKKVLALALVLAMALTLLPTAALGATAGGGGAIGGGSSHPPASGGGGSALDGYIFITDNAARLDPELGGKGVYLVNIIDVDGTETSMRITQSLRDSIAADSMILSAKRDYAGQFLSVDEVDENGVVSSLTKITALDDVVAMGYAIVTLSSGHSYEYDDVTQCIFVDMGWKDGTQANNVPNVLEPELDELCYVGSGTFTPEGFFREDEVDPDGNSTYTSVKAVVVPSATSATTADYVYVLRTLDIPVDKPSTPGGISGGSPRPPVSGGSPSLAPTPTTPTAKPSNIPSTTPSTTPSTQPSESPKPSDPAKPVAVTGVSVAKTASVQVRKTKTLTATVQPVNAANKAVYWTSDDTYVVSVDTNGKLTANHEGKATVTVTTVDGGFTATCAVTVTKASSPSGGGGGRPSGGGTVARPSAQPSAQPSSKPTDPAKPASELFSDVVKGSWYESGVTYVVNKGLFQGMSKGVFSPNTNMTRAMVMTVLARLDGQDTANATNGPWYTNIMSWAVSKGITDGTMPDSNVTRQQLVTMLYRYAKAGKTNGGLTKFTDVTQISPWAQDAMTWAVGEGILTGKDGGRLDPQGTATRAEVATIFQRFVEKKK